MIFGFGKKNETTKRQCEFCGDVINIPFWSALFSIDYIIFLKNAMVSNVNRKEQVVFLSNGQKLDFMFDFGNDQLAMPYRAKIHLLCSVNCEDDFLSQNRGGIMSQSLFEKSPTFSYRENNIFKPSAAPIDRLRTISKKCETCNSEYPDFDIEGWERKWMAYSIISKEKEYVNNNSLPSFTTDEFDQILSGVNEHKPDGYYFGYKLSKKSEEHSFCSNDCAFTFSNENNCHIIVDSILDKDRLGAIVPETEIFNKNLSNPISHRPSFFQQL